MDENKSHESVINRHLYGSYPTVQILEVLEISIQSLLNDKSGLFLNTDVNIHRSVVRLICEILKKDEKWFSPEQGMNNTVDWNIFDINPLLVLFSLLTKVNNEKLLTHKELSTILSKPITTAENTVHDPLSSKNLLCYDTLTLVPISSFSVWRCGDLLLRIVGSGPRTFQFIKECTGFYSYNELETVLNIIKSNDGKRYLDLDTMAMVNGKTAASKPCTDNVLKISTVNIKRLIMVRKFYAHGIENPVNTVAPLLATVKTPVKRTRKKAIPKTLRYTLWRNNFNNSLDGTCFCCGAEIRFEAWEAGHIVAEAEGGSTTLDNLKPLCIACNRSMGKTNMLEFKARYYK